MQKTRFLPVPEEDQNWQKMGFSRIYGFPYTKVPKMGKTPPNDPQNPPKHPFLGVFRGLEAFWGVFLRGLDPETVGSYWNWTIRGGPKTPFFGHFLGLFLRGVLKNTPKKGCFLQFFQFIKKFKLIGFEPENTPKMVQNSFFAVEKYEGGVKKPCF